jgi:hypothetical protein
MEVVSVIKTADNCSFTLANKIIKNTGDHLSVSVDSEALIRFLMSYFSTPKFIYLCPLIQNLHERFH